MIDFEEPEEIILHNPITRAQIQLPPLSTFPKLSLVRSEKPEDSYKPYEFHFISKAVLSADPTKDHDNWVLMAIVSCSGRLCFCRAKDHKWTVAGSGPVCPPVMETTIQDVIYSSGRFYAVNMFADIYSIIVGSPGSAPPKFELFAKAAHEYYATNYLVMSSGGELLEVARFVENILDASGKLRTYYTEEVTAYKLDSNTGNWQELKHLGNDVLFLGRNASLCMSRDELPELKTNCIYLTDDNFLWSEDGTKILCPDSGIYNYEDGLVQRLDEIYPCSHLPALWITPSILL